MWAFWLAGVFKGVFVFEEMIVVAQAAWAYDIHERGDKRTAELKADGVVMKSPQDILDFIGTVLWANEADHLVVHARNVAQEFFDLSTGLAGEMLQKCSNYGFRLALVGDFQSYPSESLHAFIRECNRGRHVYFAETLEEALNALHVA